MSERETTAESLGVRERRQLTGESLGVRERRQLTGESLGVRERKTTAHRSESRCQREKDDSSPVRV